MSIAAVNVHWLFVVIIIICSSHTETYAVSATVPYTSCEISTVKSRYYSVVY